MEWIRLKVLAAFKLQYTGWRRPIEICGFLSWVFHIWNDFDPLTWSNDRDVQGVRICGFEWN